MTSPEVDVSHGFSLTATGSNSAWAAAVQIVDVTVPTVTAEVIQTSYQGMGSIPHTKMAADVPDTEPMVLVCHNKQESQPIVGGANETWELTFPDAETLTFSGFISGCPVSADHNGKIMQTVTIEVSGAMI